MAKYKKTVDQEASTDHTPGVQTTLTLMDYTKSNHQPGRKLLITRSDSDNFPSNEWMDAQDVLTKQEYDSLVAIQEKLLQLAYAVHGLEVQP